MRPVVLVAVAVLLAGCGERTGGLSAGSSSAILASAVPSSAPSATAVALPQGCPPADPVKCSTPPPGYTPYPGPPCDFPLTTADEIRTAAAQMHAAPGDAPASLAAYGTPLLVHALRASDPDEWDVPTLDGRGGATSVVAVGVRSNGRGCAGIARGWSGAFPRSSLDEARRRGAAANDPVALAEAVYLPWTREVPPSAELDPVWRLVRQSGREVFLFDDGTLLEGSRLRAILSSFAPLRGDRASPTPRPSPTYPPRYATATSGEVSAGVRTDPFVLEQLRYLRAETGEPHAPVADPRVGVPLRVVGIHKPWTIDVWAVAVTDADGSVVAIITVSLDTDGLGNAFAARGWSGAFPRITEGDALRAGSVLADPAVDAKLAWAEEYFFSPGGPSAPCWLVTRRSGVAVVVSEDGRVFPVPR